MKSFDRSLDRNDYNRERAENWRQLSMSIPFIKLDPDWTIAIIPPFTGAAARFLVKNSSGAEVSVYLDTADVLGVVGEVYWEVYPDVEWCDECDGWKDADCGCHHTGDDDESTEPY